MKRLAFAFGLLVLGFAAATPARADFAVVRFNSNYCRVWTYIPAGPQDGHYVWFRSHWGGHWHHYYRFHTMAGADRALHHAIWSHVCYHA